MYRAGLIQGLGIGVFLGQLREATALHLSKLWNTLAGRSETLD